MVTVTICTVQNQLIKVSCAWSRTQRSLRTEKWLKLIMLIMPLTLKRNRGKFTFYAFSFITECLRFGLQCVRQSPSNACVSRSPELSLEGLTHVPKKSRTSPWSLPLCSRVQRFISFLLLTRGSYVHWTLPEPMSSKRKIPLIFFFKVKKKITINFRNIFDTAIGLRVLKMAF